jgi:hypothetical protein
MEDTLICPGKYVHSLRVDYLDNTREEIEIKLKKWAEKNDSIIHKYIAFEEKGETTQKLHLQGAVWTKQSLSNSVKNKMRNWWKRPKGHISFTIAKNVKSLVAYVSKDEGAYWTTLSETQIDLFPKWDNDPITTWKKNLEKKCKQLVSETNGKYEYCEAIIDYYTKNQKAPPTRNTLYKYMLRYHPQFTSSNYLVDLGMFKEPKQYNNY